MSKLPLLSSRQITAALKRAGFVPQAKSKGSHQTWRRPGPPGKPSYVVVVVLGRREVSRGVLKSIIAQSGYSEEEFLEFIQ